MSEAFDKLKELLATQKTLSNEDVEKMVAEHGEVTDEEKIWLEAEKAKLEHTERAKDSVTMEQYLEALKQLDTLEEGSDEYKKAEAIVDKYESGV
jgi:hypothetical protein